MLPRFAKNCQNRVMQHKSDECQLLHVTAERALDLDEGLAK